jgi:hypothetical protein
MKLARNKATDSLYIEPNVIRDVGEDGESVGDDPQYASIKRDLILSIILASEPSIAAE